MPLYASSRAPRVDASRENRPQTSACRTCGRAGVSTRLILSADRLQFALLASGRVRCLGGNVTSPGGEWAKARVGVELDWSNVDGNVDFLGPAQ